MYEVLPHACLSLVVGCCSVYTGIWLADVHYNLQAKHDALHGLLIDKRANVGQIIIIICELNALFKVQQMVVA